MNDLKTDLPGKVVFFFFKDGGGSSASMAVTVGGFVRQLEN